MAVQKQPGEIHRTVPQGGRGRESGSSLPSSRLRSRCAETCQRREQVCFSFFRMEKIFLFFADDEQVCFPQVACWRVDGDLLAICDLSRDFFGHGHRQVVSSHVFSAPSKHKNGAPCMNSSELHQALYRRRWIIGPLMRQLNSSCTISFLDRFRKLIFMRIHVRCLCPNRLLFRRCVAPIAQALVNLLLLPVFGKFLNYVWFIFLLGFSTGFVLFSSLHFPLILSFSSFPVCFYFFSSIIYFYF